jgi:aspartyl-tRNA(Asn)/glutamyl-tRNA(Gln) amidotransferase subunit A
MASSLDQIGPIAKTVEDAKILFKTIAGKDNLDATSSDPEKSWEEKLKEKNIEKIRELTIGIPDEYFISGISKEVEKEVENAIEKIKSLGIKFKKISLPHTKYALSCYYIIMTAEVSSNLARFDGIRYSRNKNIQLKEESLEELYFKQRGNGLGEESKRRTILGSFVLSSGYYDAYYEKAQRVRQLIKNDFDNVFKDIDVVLSPVVPSTAFKIGEKNNDPLQMYLSDIFTIPANLAGVPAISIPTKKDLKEGELPIGFQLIGKKWKEEDLFGIGEFYEKL